CRLPAQTCAGISQPRTCWPASTRRTDAALAVPRRQAEDHELSAPGHDCDVAPERHGRGERGAAELALRHEPARGRGVNAQAPGARDNDHRVVCDRRHGTELTAEVLRPEAPE